MSLPYCKAIRDRLNQRLAEQKIDTVPVVLFAKGGGHSLREQAEAGFEVIGVDYSMSAAEARAAVGPDVTLQGNLDPQALYKPEVSESRGIFQERCVMKECFCLSARPNFAN